MTNSTPISPEMESATSPNFSVDSIGVNLQRIAQAKWKLDDFSVRQDELLAELTEFQKRDAFIEKTQETINELNKEKEAHSDIIQSINKDKDDLEKVMASLREEQRELQNNLILQYQQIFELIEQANKLATDSGIPETELIKPTILPQNAIANAAQQALANQGQPLFDGSYPETGRRIDAAVRRPFTEHVRSGELAQAVRKSSSEPANEGMRIVPPADPP
uniref:Uncharacterized protein n=1 Tax=Panagrolaimus sp. JU765 TaxID=591449 RepID=A0AC34Q538_9BILA